jgi:hypothetical protein
MCRENTASAITDHAGKGCESASIHAMKLVLKVLANTNLPRFGTHLSAEEFTLQVQCLTGGLAVGGAQECHLCVPRDSRG